jgi:hypothetical protein
MTRRWTCARWPAAAWCSGAAATALLAAGCGGSGGAAPRGGAPAGLGSLPVVSPGQPCPVSPQRVHPRYGPILGDGPAYPSLTFLANGVLELAPAGGFRSHEWSGEKVLWVQRPGAPRGLVVRGRRIDGPGGLRFDDGRPPPARLVLPTPDRRAWVERPGYTRVRSTGCYAYVVQGPGIRRVVVFRAVRIRHRSAPGPRVLGVTAQQLERGIVDPAGEPRVAEPSAADCRATTRAERRRSPFGGARRLFSCAVTDTAGTGRYTVLVLPDGCYTADLQRHRGQHTRGIEACL